MFQLDIPSHSQARMVFLIFQNYFPGSIAFETIICKQIQETFKNGTENIQIGPTEIQK